VSAQRPELSAEDILAALNGRGVQYVVIGAFAVIAQGAPIDVTYDVDVTPQRDPDNLERLSLALGDLDARIRVNDLDEGLPFSHDARSLARMDMLNLTCPAGDFDIVFFPAGAPAGYDDLAPRSVLITVGGQDVRVASLADVVHSKEEAGRDKDIRALPALRRFLRDHPDRRPPAPDESVDK
jgi:hypothetical protein